MRDKRAIFAIAISTAALTWATSVQAQTEPGETPAPDATTVASATSENTGQDIIVTASRRQERLRDVPSSITALDGDKLNQIGAHDATDYLSLAPGVSFRDAGTPGQGTTIIRGLNSGAQQLTSTVATYIDDVPFTASGFLGAGALLNPDPDVADLDRIEILKGPQGTLYGANSLGGIVRIVSNQPDVNAFSAFAQVEGSTTDHGADGYSVHGSINVPFGDQLALRLNGVYRRIGGFVDNVATGEDDFNWSTIKGGRAALRWQPSSRLTVDLNGMLQDIHNNGSSTQTNVGATTTPLYGRYDYYGRLDIPSDLRYRLASGSINYDFGPVTLIATGSYGQYRTHILSDYTDSYYAYALIASPAYAAVLPANGQALGNFSPNLDKWTGEVRAVSKRLGPIEFIAGGFYTNEHNNYVTTLTAKDATGANLTGNFPATGVPLANLIVTRTLSDYEEIAGYLNGTFYITDNLDIGGGVRYAHNDQTAATGADPNADTFYAPRARQDFKFRDSVATYLATIRYRPTSNISLYLRAASGYRPGGPQTNPNPPAGAQTVVNPDTTWNYEGGIKASFGAFSIDASVFHIDWKDIQLNTLSGGIVLGANGGKAKVDGFELALAARPGPFTTFSANAGYTNARMVEVDSGVQAYLGVVPGDKLPLTPDWTVNLLADQGIPLGNGLKGNIGATVRFRADMPSSFPGSLTDPNIKIPSVTTVDLRAGVDFGRYEVQVRAENVFDEFGYDTLSTPRVYATQVVPTVASVIRPRTLSLSIAARF